MPSIVIIYLFLHCHHGFHDSCYITSTSVIPGHGLSLVPDISHTGWLTLAEKAELVSASSIKLHALPLIGPSSPKSLGRRTTLIWIDSFRETKKKGNKNQNHDCPQDKHHERKYIMGNPKGIPKDALAGKLRGTNPRTAMVMTYTK